MVTQLPVVRSPGFMGSGLLGRWGLPELSDFLLRHKGQDTKQLLARWRAQWTPPLHVWPKILCKALVKVGFPPGEAMARSLILEGE